MKKEPLFELIKKMKQTEKSYFKKKSSAHKRNSKNNFLILFDLIEKQKKYNEEKLKHIIGHKHFAQKKKHLQEKILLSLRSYYSKDNPDTQIQLHLHDHSIFLSKSMFRSAQQSIEKAKIIAVKSENYHLLLHILKKQIELFKIKNDQNEIDIQINQYKETVKKVNQLLNEHLELEELYLTIILWNKKMEHIRDKNELKKLKSIFNHPSISLNTIPESIRSRSMYYYINALFYYLQGSYKNAGDFFKKELVLYEDSDWLKNNQTDYIRSLANNCLMAALLNKNSFFNECFIKLKEIRSNDLFLTELLFYYITLLKLYKLSKETKYDKALRIIERSETRISTIEKSIIEKEILQNELTIMTFSKIDVFLNSRLPKKALQIINHHLNNYDHSLKKDTYILSRIINIIVHFELENMDYLEYEIESTKKLLRNKNTSFKLERSVLQFIDKIHKSKSKNQNAIIHSKLIDELQVLKKDPFEITAFQFFDFECWANKIIKA